MRLSQMGYKYAAKETGEIVLHAAQLFDPSRPLNQSIIPSLLRSIMQPTTSRRLDYSERDVVLVLESLQHACAYQPTVECVRLSEYLYCRNGFSHLDNLAYSLELLAIWTSRQDNRQIRDEYHQAIGLRRIDAAKKPDNLAKVLTDYGKFLCDNMGDQSGALEASLEAMELYRSILSTGSVATSDLESCADVLHKLGRRDQAWHFDSEVLAIYRKKYTEGFAPDYFLCRSIHRNAFNLLIQRRWRAGRDLLAELSRFLPLQERFQYSTDLQTFSIMLEVLDIMCRLGEGMDCRGDAARISSVFQQETLQLKCPRNRNFINSDVEMSREIWGVIASDLGEHGYEELHDQICKVLDHQTSWESWWLLDGEDIDSM